ncbi:adenine-specific DNA-methyltransferase [Acidaminococcus fermentans]|uniref:Adenine-specific DNA-methyltransferase n=2 Tax=Acidaminococcus fermentans TaxID=905 RepID=A0A1H2ZHQ9_ACIFE|nr:DNA methyltransferase [uncultured Acidaminococcus sp.]SDX17032.1 adenine-specific DNA-methyltransferase [Acidaminococcus fermentans]
MALLQDLIKQVDDPDLRDRILQEVDKMSKQKKFGLVFEEHLPECTPLYDVKIKRGSKVSLKTGKVNDIYIVNSIDGKEVTCEHRQDHHIEKFKLEDLVAVAEFGEPIYPYLKLVDSICNAPDSDLWHTLIEADNYHALQLLEYLYAEKVDCIYIDPPYNTGAKDWKYNNDYVDSTDQYRHSKWLSFMEKRLKLAKKLLNPKNSVLIVTIDEKEYAHLGCLLEEIFQGAKIQMISSVINPAVVARDGEFGRSGEYIYFLFFGESSPQRVMLDREWVSQKGRTHTGNIRWDLLKRSGTGATRKDSPGGFYPIYIEPESGKIEKIGDPLPEGISEAPKINGLLCLLPIRQDGSEGRWQWSVSTLKEGIKQGRVKTGGNAKRGYTVYRLARAEYQKFKNGEFKEIGRGINNEIIVADINTDQVLAIPGDIWKISSHDSTQYGSRLLSNILKGKRFTFPKSLYAVKDAIRFVTANKKDALVIDFFAGSGTTLHAVNLLNAEDGGHRRCIMVTNNEVSDAEAKSLKKQGYKPGDEEWEKLGIARYVTWPRSVCSIEGHDLNGEPLKGNYIGSNIPMADGFKANATYFKLGFLNKNAVALGRQFKELLPVLWMKANCIGPCPQLDTDMLPTMLVLPKNKFAVLIDETFYSEFDDKLMEHPEIKTVYIITDSESAYREMIQSYVDKDCYQLYRDYLDNFRINTER